MKHLYIFILISIVFCTSCSQSTHISKKGWMFHDGYRERVVRIAKRYIGIRYRDGGETPWGFDCSGFVMFVYRKSGLNVPRTAIKQYRSGRKIDISLAKPGDLVFFNIYRNRISHVGVYLGDFIFIHSPSKGKEISYASMENPYWRNRYVGAVTYVKE